MSATDDVLDGLRKPEWIVGCKNCKQLQAENEKLKDCISITLSEVENRLAGIDFEIIERRLKRTLKGCEK